MTNPFESSDPRTGASLVRSSGIAPADVALQPVLRSALGVMRESAGLVCHVAALGVALVWQPKRPRPGNATAPPRPGGQNIIPFPSNRPRTARHRLGGNR